MIYVIGDTGSSELNNCADLLSRKLAHSTENKVLLINTSKSRTFSLSQKKNLSYFDFQGNNLKKEIRNSATVYDDIVINCNFGQNLFSALEVADQLIVPCDARTPTITIWILTKFEQVISQTLKSNSFLQAFYHMPNAHMASKALIKVLAKNQHLSCMTSEPQKQLLEAQ